MVPSRRFVRVAAAVLALSMLVGSGVVLPLGHGVVTAGHGPADGDFTVEPMSDRSPGATDVKYGMIVVGTADVDYETLEKMTAVYEEGSFSRCGPGDSEVFGIDRGNTHNGYEVDESLEDNVKSFSAGENHFEVEFYDEEDFGSSTSLEQGDAIKSVATCMDNPDEPGWYQISGSTTGVTESGERVTIGSESHYFGICECQDEAEAREKLGPPPSEDDGTPTPTPTPDSGSTAGDTSGGDTTGNSAATQDQRQHEATPTPNAAAAGPTPTPTGTAEPSSTPTDAAASWDRHVVRTPTPGDGDGFGGVVGLVAVVGAALLARYRA